MLRIQKAAAVVHGTTCQKIRVEGFGGEEALGLAVVEGLAQKAGLVESVVTGGFEIPFGDVVGVALVFPHGDGAGSDLEGGERGGFKGVAGGEPGEVHGEWKGRRRKEELRSGRKGCTGFPC